MTKEQMLKSAVNAFRPGVADAPVLYASVEVGKNGLMALLGRNRLKRSANDVVAAICITLAVIVLAVSILTGHLALIPAAFSILTMSAGVYRLRFAIIAIEDTGLDFYFVDTYYAHYEVYDKFSLPYDKIANVTMRKGKIFKNTNFTFDFLSDGLRLEIRASMPNRTKKIKEQGENLKVLLEVLEKKQIRHRVRRSIFD